MAKLSFLSFLKRAGIGSESIVMSNLNIPSGKNSKDKSDDFSTYELSSEDFLSPKLAVENPSMPQIPIISVGGCGVRIASAIAKRFKEYGLEYPILGIETNENELNNHDLISNKFLIPNTNAGTAKQYRKGATLAIENKTAIDKAVDDYLQSIEMRYDHEIVFLIFGAGGTGVGVSYELAKYLIEKGKRPVPIIFFPGREENTRIQFTAAAALYRFSYGPKEQCLNLCSLLVDNDYFFEKNSRKNFATTLYAINERIGSTITDLLISTELDSVGYSADLNEFLEVFRNIRGVGMLNFMHSGGDYSNLNDFFTSKYAGANSGELDIYQSTRSYLFIESTQDKVSAREYRMLISGFDNSDIFPKFTETISEETNFEIRGIFTGLKLTSRIESLLQKAQDARVELLNTEITNTADGKDNPKINRLNADEEIDVKTGEELAKERSEEFAEYRRTH
ncbi:MAG: Tubulin-like protein CetZ [Candidatus Heimdallarchaeota archaeon LC_2]|nr:MAG: Tubulin-like protein CetZ [Candidatus Heimdallarchaeota archaeon LC_2]